jgi:hypothetical protein
LQAAGGPLSKQPWEAKPAGAVLGNGEEVQFSPLVDERSTTPAANTSSALAGSRASVLQLAPTVAARITVARDNGFSTAVSSHASAVPVPSTVKFLNTAWQPRACSHG